MSIEILMPALSPTMEEGKLARWLVKEGDEVRSGDILAEIETDKATMEFEAVDEGKIGKIVVPEGSESVKVGTVIALIEVEGEESSTPAATTSAEAGPPGEDAIASAQPTEAPASAGAQEKAAEPETTPQPKKADSGAAQLAADAKPAKDPAIPAGTNMQTV